MAIILTLAGVFILLVPIEVWSRHHKKQNEFSRKFAHISVGTFAAFWPFYLSFLEVKYLAALGLAVLVFSKYFNVFKSIHNVERATWGEVCSGLSVGILAFLTHNKWIYAASMLQMALGDGLAAVMGTAYGKKTTYKILGSTKSLVGSLAFFITSVVILLVFKQTGQLGSSALYLGFVSLIATGLENVGVKGLDNLFVPIFVLLMISH